MSGGVDSSVAAGLLVEQGYQVVGVSLRLWEGANLGPRNCSDHRGAAEVAALLGIPHTVLDHRDDFRRVVVAPFAQSYLEGTTPNPCVACNRNFKIEKLLAWAEDRGIPHVATGHYARIGRAVRQRLAAARFGSQQGPVVLSLRTLAAPTRAHPVPTG